MQMPRCGFFVTHGFEETRKRHMRIGELPFQHHGKLVGIDRRARSLQARVNISKRRVRISVRWVEVQGVADEFLSLIMYRVMNKRNRLPVMTREIRLHLERTFERTLCRLPRDNRAHGQREVFSSLRMMGSEVQDEALHCDRFRAIARHAT